MNECLLCKRDMKVSKETFGKGCLKNIYSFLNFQMPKKEKQREETLYKSIMKETNIKNINKDQKILLTDRYLTYKYIEKVPYGNFEEIKKQINTDIQNINTIRDANEMPSVKQMSLNQAYNLYKKATSFTEGINQLRKGNFTDTESLKLIRTVFSYILNMGINKKQYEDSYYKGMQYAFWQTVIEIGGKYVEFGTSAYFLQHSLEENPNDLYITEGKIVEDIRRDNQFRSTINSIVKKYGENCDEFVFDSQIDKKFPLKFNEKDLYYAIHLADLNVEGKKQSDKWNVIIRLHDRYDYSKAKNLIEYYNDTNSVLKSLFSSTLYNLAHISVKSGVIKEYEIDIQFDFEVNA